jgi:hypothetical protein
MYAVRSLRSALCAALVLPSVFLAGCDDPVRTPAVASVEITAPSTPMEIGDTVRLTAKARDAVGREVSGRMFTWASSNEAVASVQDGLVTGRGPGSATITASVDGQQGQVEVVVRPPAPALVVEPDSFLLVEGKSVRIPGGGITVAWSDGRKVTVPDSLRFGSSAPGVATVSDSGVVRAVSAGEATIEVRRGQALARLHLRVERPFTLTYLGTLPGAAASAAHDINTTGQVVGTSGSQVFVWENGAMRQLTFPGQEIPSAGIQAPRSRVVINDRGEVAGLFFRSVWHVFLRRADGTIVVPDSARHQQRFVSDLNNRGEVVGGWYDDLCNRNCSGGGWVLREGKLVALNNHGALRIQPNAINDAGQIAASLYYRGSSFAEGRAAFLQSDGAAPVFAPIGIESFGEDIDSRGRVYGVTNRPFSWQPGGAVNLLAPRYHPRVRANERGVAVAGGGPGPVMLWNGAAIPLNELFVAGDWTFEEAMDINDRGQIVGYGKHRVTGARGALLLTPAQ